MIIGFVEHDRGKLNPLSLEALTFGRRLADRLGLPLHAVLVGSHAEPLADGLGAHGVTVVHLLVHERMRDYAPAAWAQGIVEIVDEQAPEAVLAAGSERSNEVMAHVAAKTGLAMAANCTEVQPDEPYVVTRLRWGGSLMEVARLEGVPKLLTIAPHALAAEPAPIAREPAVRTVTPTIDDDDLRVRVTDRLESGAGAVSLAEARVVVGGGRGVGGADGFRALEELAELLGGVVGASRVVTSLGWRQHADQIGQTGTRIAPDLYIACGISGAIQHMVGCKAAKHILAINTDREAPIVAKAEYAIIGDLHAIVPALNAEIRRAKEG